MRHGPSVPRRGHAAPGAPGRQAEPGRWVGGRWWDQDRACHLPAALTESEWERVRLHLYYTERMLSRCPGLAEAAVALRADPQLDPDAVEAVLGAAGLGVSRRTVDHHIAPIYDKTGVSTRGAVVPCALDNGIAQL